MRTAFIETLCELAAVDERIWLVCGDLGYSVLERFAERFPERFVNAGVAEQNMTGLAAGVALSGHVVFTYSIANFPVMRCLEQIRNDVCYHRANVKVVAVGGGLAYGAHGYTHHGVEDLAVMRVMPHMTVLAPGDPYETRWAVKAALAHEGPFYLRLGKAGEPAVHTREPDAELGKLILVREGNGPAFLSTGGMLPVVAEAVQILAREGIAAAHWSVPCLQPLDTASILEIASRAQPIVTVEEHGEGGLAAAVAEVVAKADRSARLLPLRLEGTPSVHSGTQQFLRVQAGLDPTSIAMRVREAWNRRGSCPAEARSR